jgi:hypothetical protein
MIFFIFSSILPIIFIATSKLEWALLKNDNIYNSWKQIYNENLTSLLWALFFHFFYYPFLSLVFLYMPMTYSRFVRLTVEFLPSVIIFIIIRLRYIKSLPCNNSLKMDVIRLSIIDMIIFCSFILALVMLFANP